MEIYDDTIYIFTKFIDFFNFNDILNETLLKLNV